MHKEFQHKLLLASGSEHDILMFIADDVALAVIFYLFLNIRQTITRGDKSCGQAQGQAQRPWLSAAGYHAFMPAVNAFMQPINAFMQALLPPRGGDQRVHSAYQRRMLVLSDPLVVVWDLHYALY